MMMMTAVSVIFPCIQTHLSHILFYCPAWFFSTCRLYVLKEKLEREKLEYGKRKHSRSLKIQNVEDLCIWGWMVVIFSFVCCFIW